MILKSFLWMVATFISLCLMTTFKDVTNENPLVVGLWVLNKIAQWCMNAWFAYEVVLWAVGVMFS